MFSMLNGLLLMEGIDGFCSNTHQLLAIVGWILTVFKIAIPIIIIILGLIDLGKAAVSDKPEEIKKSATSLLYRLIGGVAIFFVPMIIMTAFGWVSGWDKATSELGEYNNNGYKTQEWNICKACIINPWSDDCAKIEGKYDNESK